VNGRIGVEHRAGVARLTIDNPTQRNALTREMLGVLRAELERIAEAGDSRAVMLRGAGGLFSSGFAIDQIPRPEDLPVDDDIELLCRTIERIPVVVAAAIEGLCVGAALDVACACDLRFATADARLGITPSKLGLVYSWRGTNRVLRVGGRDAARYLVYSGELLRADSDLGRRLVTKVTPDAAALSAEVERFVSTVAVNAPLSLAGAKAIFTALDATVSLPEKVATEIHASRQRALGSEDCAEARAAFADRRSPVFSGR
jgi:enoyl-CoA hydratase/carnithine racemase